jgi:uncharacterized membrane protein
LLHQIPHRRKLLQALWNAATVFSSIDRSFPYHLSKAPQEFRRSRPCIAPKKIVVKPLLEISSLPLYFSPLLVRRFFWIFSSLMSRPFLPLPVSLSGRSPPVHR